MPRSMSPAKREWRKTRQSPPLSRWALSAPPASGADSMGVPEEQRGLVDDGCARHPRVTWFLLIVDVTWRVEHHDVRHDVQW
jgi:hypothetical protein